MYRILQEEGIDLPRYAVLDRDPNKPEGQSSYFVLIIFDHIMKVHGDQFKVAQAGH